jgi:hypothetical protein
VFDVVAARLVSLTTASRARSAIPESS